MEINIELGFIASSMIDTIMFRWEEWNSKSLATMDYPHDVKGLLTVKFKNNALYKYPNVALLDVFQIIGSESIGTAFHDIIVGKGYKYEKISLNQAQSF